MSQETIYFMLHKILEFEKFEDRIFDLENKNVELEVNWRIMKDQLDKLTQNGKLSEVADSEIQSSITDIDAGSNFTENHFENDKISTGQEDQETNFIKFREMNANLNGSQDGNHGTDLTIEEIKSEGNEWNCSASTSNIIEENVKILPVSTTSTSTSIQITSISSEREFQNSRSNLSFFSKNSKALKLLQNVVIPLKRVDSDPNFKSKMVSQKNETKDGLKLKQESKKNLKCPFCTREFQKSANLSRHMRIHTEEKPYNCPICSKSFAFLKTFSRHCTFHSKNKVIEGKLTKSDTCSFQSGSRDNQCKICPKFFKFQSSLENHMKVHGKSRYEEKAFKCSTCSSAFTNKILLKKHNRIHTGEKPYSCSICQKKFTQSYNLTIHNRTHTREKPYNCPMPILKTFSRHSSIVHSKKDNTTKTKSQRTVKLDTYTQNFHSDSSSRKNLRTHSGEKPYSCPECQKKFTQTGSLNRHMMMIHDEEKPYECKICSRFFTLQYSLNSHLLIHSGEKPYSCSVCLKKFTQTGSLNRHKRSHDEEKPYGCQFCSKYFCTKYQLIIHTRYHTGEKPYECSNCLKKFICSSTLNLHKRLNKCLAI